MCWSWWGHQGEHESSMSPCGKEEPLVSWAALDKVLAAGGGR